MPTSSDVVVIALAQSELEATLWADALRDAGIKAGLFERGVGAALGGGAHSLSTFAIVVGREREQDARAVLLELGAGEQLLPETPTKAQGGSGRWIRYALWFGLPIAAVATIVGRMLAG